MRIAILCRGILPTQAIRDYAQRRLKTALGRYQSVLASVQVRLADVNGPRGGVDKTCQVRLVGPGVAAIVVHAAALELSAAVDDALHRAAEAVARALGRRRDVAVTA